MSAQQSLRSLIELSEVIYNRAIKGWKEKGGKVVGFFCSYVPEEIIYAADVLPYRIRPVGCTEVPLANIYMTSSHCTFARGCLEFILGGKFDFLDGLVSMNSCDTMRHIPDIMSKGKVSKEYRFMHFLSVPYKICDDAMKWYEIEIANFKKSLEDFVEKEITDKKLLDAIEVYNETRNLLKKLYELRKQKKPPITGSETLSITIAATVAPKHEYNQLLSEALEELRREEGISDYRARLMLLGSALDSATYVKIIEELGGLVCTDAICFGSRYFWSPVEKGGNLLSNLAKSYLNRPSCARIVDQFPKKDDYLEKMIRDYKIDGVIHQRIRYCDLWGGDLLLVRRKLNEMNIGISN